MNDHKVTVATSYPSTPVGEILKGGAETTERNRRSELRHPLPPSPFLWVPGLTS